MSKKINVEIGLCTKEMAKENPIKDFEILIEEYKDKWSEQMYDYFKECLNEIKKEHKVLEIIKIKQVNISALLELDDLKQYNDYCVMVGGHKRLTKEEYDLLKEVLL